MSNQLDKLPVALERGVGRQQAESVLHHLRHQQAIEGISVHPRQRRHTNQVRRLDRPLDKTLGQQRPTQQTRVDRDIGMAQ